MSVNIIIATERVDIRFAPEALVTALGGEVKRLPADPEVPEFPASHHILLSVPAILKRTGIGKRMIIAGSAAGKVDPALVKLLVKAFDLRDKLLVGHGASLEQIASREAINGSYATRLLRLSFLSPRIVRDILDGSHPPTLTARQLMLDTKLPLAWDDQLASMH